MVSYVYSHILHICLLVRRNALRRTGVCRVSDRLMYSTAGYRMYIRTPYTPASASREWNSLQILGRHETSRVRAPVCPCHVARSVAAAV